MEDLVVVPPPPPPHLVVVPPPPPHLVVVPPPPPPIKHTHPWTGIDFSHINTELSPTNFHNYQCDMVNFLINNPKEAMLYTFLGSGKTSAVLSLMAYERAWGRKGRMLVVAPKTVCQLTWQQEAIKWAHTRSLTIENMSGGAKHRQTTLFRSNADIVLINYESLGWLQLQLNAYFINQDKPLPFEYIVFDEISKMKESKSQRFKDFAPITKHFKSRIGLTASPSSEGILGTWSQFYLLDQGDRLGVVLSDFREQYFHKTDGAHGKWIPYDNDRTKQMVVSKVQDMTLILEAKGNIEMPPCTIIDRFVTLSAKNMKKYLILEAELFLELDSGGTCEVQNSVALSNKLLQVGSGFIYEQEDPDDLATRETHYIHTQKNDELDTVMEETADEPILLFYGFKAERLRIMEKYPKARCITGASDAEAVDMLNEFNSGRLKLLLGHPASFAYGINAQKACSIVLWFTLTYSLEKYLQANGRVDRQGQKNPVRIFRLIAKDTIEEYIATRLRQKKEDEDSFKSMLIEYQSTR